MHMQIASECLCVTFHNDNIFSMLKLSEFQDISSTLL